ncbi:unnamed protein product, partial [Notodromas monacha]
MDAVVAKEDCLSSNPWKPKEDHLLIKYLLDVSKEDKRNAIATLRYFKWLVKIPGRSAEDVKNRWRFLSKHVSFKRTLFEVANDLNTKIDYVSGSEHLTLSMAKDHPDFPRDPKNASTLYVEAVLRKMERESPGTSRDAQFSKVVKGKFRSLPDAKKAKYLALAREEREIYEMRKDDFFAANPQYIDGSQMPKLPPTPFALFLKRKGIETESPRVRLAQRKIFEALTYEKTRRFYRKALDLGIETESPRVRLAQRKIFEALTYEKTRRFYRKALDLVHKFYEELGVYVAIHIKDPLLPDRFARVFKEVYTYRRMNKMSFQQQGGFMRFAKEVSAEWTEMLWKEKLKKAAEMWKKLPILVKRALSSSVHSDCGFSSFRVMGLNRMIKHPVFVYAFKHLPEFRREFPDLEEPEMRSVIIERYHSLAEAQQNSCEDEGKSKVFIGTVMKALKQPKPEEELVLPPADAKAMFLKNIAAQSSPRKGLQNSPETFEALSKAEKASLAKSLEEEEETFATKFKEFAATATPKTLVNYLRGMCQTSSMPESDANYEMQNGAANDENYLDEDMESECDNYFWEGDEDFEADYEEDFRTKPEEDFDNGYDGGLNDTQLTDDFEEKPDEGFVPKAGRKSGNASNCSDDAEKHISKKKQAPRKKKSHQFSSDSEAEDPQEHSRKEVDKKSKFFQKMSSAAQAVREVPESPRNSPERLPKNSPKKSSVKK